MDHPRGCKSSSTGCGNPNRIEPCALATLLLNMAAKGNVMIRTDAGALELMCGTQDCFT